MSEHRSTVDESGAVDDTQRDPGGTSEVEPDAAIPPLPEPATQSREDELTRDAEPLGLVADAEESRVRSWLGRLLRRLPRPMEGEEAIAELVSGPGDEVVLEVASVPDEVAELAQVHEAAPLSSDEILALIRRELARVQAEAAGISLSELGEARARVARERLSIRGWWPVLLGLLLVAALGVLGIFLPRTQTPREDIYGDIFVEIAALHQSAGNSQEAVQTLERAVELGLSDATAWARAGQMFRVAREYQTAASAYERAVAMETDNSDYRVGLARSYAGLGRHQDAIEQFAAAMELEVDDPEWIYVEMGNAYVALDQHEQARTHYQSALQIDPGNAVAHYRIGESYLVEERYAEAIPHYQEAIELHRNPPWSFYLGLGLGYAGTGAYTEALIEYSRSQAADPDRPDPYYWSGEAYRSLGRHDEAVNAHQKAIELKPKSAAYQLGLAQDYLAMDDCEQAVPVFSRVLELEPNNEMAIQGLATCESR